MGWFRKSSNYDKEKSEYKAKAVENSNKRKEWVQGKLNSLQAARDKFENYRMNRLQKQTEQLNAQAKRLKAQRQVEQSRYEVARLRQKRAQASGGLFGGTGSNSLFGSTNLEKNPFDSFLKPAQPAKPKAVRKAKRSKSIIIKVR